jgi:putative transposase
MVGPVAVREGVAHLRTVFEISERRACSIRHADRKMVRYRSCRPPETALRERLRTLTTERRRFGYRRISGGGQLSPSLPRPTKLRLRTSRGLEVHVRVIVRS